MLTAAERKALKAKAHKLDPVVQIGTKGLTDEVIAEIDRALCAHELIKVRAGSLGPGPARRRIGLDLRTDQRGASSPGRKGLRAVQEKPR